MAEEIDMIAEHVGCHCQDITCKEPRPRPDEEVKREHTADNSSSKSTAKKTTDQESEKG